LLLIFSNLQYLPVVETEKSASANKMTKGTSLEEKLDDEIIVYLGENKQFKGSKKRLEEPLGSLRSLFSSRGTSKSPLLSPVYAACHIDPSSLRFVLDFASNQDVDGKH